MLLNEDKLGIAKIVRKASFIDNLFILVAFLTGSDRVPILGMKSMKVREKCVGSSEKLNARREIPFLKATMFYFVYFYKHT